MMDAAAPRRWLRVQHDTVYQHDRPVEQAHHLACLQPRETLGQQVRYWQLLISPRPDLWTSDEPPPMAISRDRWGNGRLLFGHQQAHQRLQVRSCFEAGLLMPLPLQAAPGSSPPWEHVAALLRYRGGGASPEEAEFVLASPLARPDTALAAFARRAFQPGRTLAAGALALMNQIHAELRYLPQSTDVGTRADQVLALGQGVCQDFAHLMIGACRSLGLAARYVSGYLLTLPPPGQPRLLGADASHAWVQVWCPQQGWLALDPTNNIATGQDHVTLAWGRDYADVAPLRGVLRGGGQAQPWVSVTVVPLDEPC